MLWAIALFAKADTLHQLNREDGEEEVQDKVEDGGGKIGKKSNKPPMLKYLTVIILVRTFFFNDMKRIR